MSKINNVEKRDVTVTITLSYDDLLDYVDMVIHNLCLDGMNISEEDKYRIISEIVSNIKSHEGIVNYYDIEELIMNEIYLITFFKMRNNKIRGAKPSPPFQL